MSKFVVTLAGDSGDGIQLLGNAFSDNIAQEYFDLSTLPDFPAEIRAPGGTESGVSGFQIQFGNEIINTAGNKSDVFVAFNAAAIKKYFRTLKPTGVLVYDPSGFDAKNCKLANFDLEELNKIPNRKIEVEFSKLTREALRDYSLTDKEKDKNKNIFALGFLAFGIDTDIEKPKRTLNAKFKGDVLDRMHTVLLKGFHFAETIEFSIENYHLTEPIIKGAVRNIMGNKAIALAILSIPKIFGRNVFFGGYPITPASEILHELVKYNVEEIEVRQAEDEIAAVSMALGASYGGRVGITASSGPGIDLKQEAIGLAHMAEIPLLIIDVQRAGPSTGMPTKVEQSDLNIALKGRHGDCPIPVVAIKSPSTAFDTTLQAVEMAIKYQTPVFLLSDTLIANSSDLWQIPSIVERNTNITSSHEVFSRTDQMVKPWISPGEEGKNYIVGGLEKDFVTGAISYDGKNHEKMTQVRLQKILNIAHDIPECKLEENSIIDGGALVLSWGSTYGAVAEAVNRLWNTGSSLAHIHLEWIFPFPKNFLDIMNRYDTLIIPELNSGQLADYVSSYFKKRIIKINKLEGIPFFEEELAEEIRQYLG